MGENVTDTNQLPIADACPQHSQPAKWACGFCGKPLCSQCGAVAWNYKAFHKECLPKAREEAAKQTAVKKKDDDRPSTGVKIVAWSYIVTGIVVLGTAFLLLGLAVFSQSLPLRAFMNGPVNPTLDTIPGGRTMLTVIGLVCLALAGLLAFLGIGLLNYAAGARRTVLFFAWLQLITDVIAWMTIWVLGEGFWDIPVIPVALIWFFSRKSVKKQFEQVL